MTPEARALALDDALYAEDPVVRDGARTRLAQRADDATLAALVALLDAPQRTTRRRAGRILAEVRPERARPPLVEALADAARPDRLRAAAARILGILSPRDEPSLAAALVTDASPRVRRVSATPAAGADALHRALSDPDATVADEAAAVLLERTEQPDAAAVAAAMRV